MGLFKLWLFKLGFLKGSGMKSSKFPSKLYAKIVSPQDLQGPDRVRMFEIMTRYYDNVDFAEFKRDLAAKDRVILLLEKQCASVQATTPQCSRSPGPSQIATTVVGSRDSIQGFSTLKHLVYKIDGKKVRGIFSGDTILEKKHWGSRVLGKAFLAHLFKQRLKNLRVPLYWFLISKGYKTYLLMANNFAEHYPRFESDTPGPMQSLMDRAYGDLYPENYHPASGLILFSKNTCKLKSSVASIETAKLKSNPRVDHFEKLNPGWEKGNELCCVAKMTLSMPFNYWIKSLKKLYGKKLPSGSRTRSHKLTPNIARQD